MVDAAEPGVDGRRPRQARPVGAARRVD
jgi:hypothetical protein